MPNKTHRSQSAVFRSSPQNSLTQTESLAASLGWPCRGEVPADPDNGIPFEVQWSAGPNLTLHFLVDDVSNSASVCVTGADEKAVEAAGTLVFQSVDSFSYDELLQKVHSTEDSITKSRYLVRASIGAPISKERQLLSLVRSYLESDDKILQEGAIWATTYTPWPEYLPLLRDYLERNRASHLASTAETIIEAFNQGSP